MKENQDYRQCCRGYISSNMYYDVILVMKSSFKLSRNSDFPFRHFFMTFVDCWALAEWASAIW